VGDTIVGIELQGADDVLTAQSERVNAWNQVLSR
jgi:hypothetical protein